MLSYIFLSIKGSINLHISVKFISKNGILTHILCILPAYVLNIYCGDIVMYFFIFVHINRNFITMYSFPWIFCIHENFAYKQFYQWNSEEFVIPKYLQMTLKFIFCNNWKNWITMKDLFISLYGKTIPVISAMF